MRNILLLGAVAVLTAAPAEFTLEQVMGAPFASELTASPKGGVAWVFNSRGVRNIWVAGRSVTAYSADDGQEITSLRWTPDGASLVFVRGGLGSEEALWIVPAARGEPRRLDDGWSPAVSPKGDRVAYVKQGQVWSAALTGEPGPAQLFKARGNCGSLRWSPDGTSLAFVSTREDNSLVGVYEAATKTVRYLDPSVDRDDSPVWSRDGKRIAFLRIPNARVLALVGPKREAPPWSIRVAEASTGRGREIWRAKAGRGSVFRVVEGEDQLLWADGDRLVFPWEGDGWTHLYSVAAAGGEAVLLTPGEFEVEQVALGRDGKQVVYSSNQGDRERRHLWRTGVGGGTPAAVTSGESIEWSPVVVDEGGTVAFIRSDARTPGRPYLVSDGKPRDLAPDSLPRDFPLQAMVTPREVSFTTADGMEIQGQLFLPGDLKPGEKRPAVAFFHGGSRRQMLLGWHGMEYYHNAYAFNQYLVSRGYVVLSVNYRGGTGYGMEFREALHYGATGASEMNDVVGAGEYLKSLPEVESASIGLWGGSYGGYLTALGLANASELFAAGVDLHGIHDWRTEARLFLPSDDFETQQAALRTAWEASPLADVKSWRSPVLLVHGDDDRSVQFKQTVRLVEALRAQGVEFEQLIFPDERHEFLMHAHWLAAFHAAAEFFDKHLR